MDANAIQKSLLGGGPEKRFYEREQRSHKKYNYLHVKSIPDRQGRSEDLGLPSINVVTLYPKIPKKILRINRHDLSHDKKLKGILTQINKELSLEKKRYFESISTEQAFVLRHNSPSNITQIGTAREIDIKCEDVMETLMTPKFKSRRVSLLPRSEPNRAEMKIREMRQQELAQFTPWNFEEKD